MNDLVVRLMPMDQNLNDKLAVKTIEIESNSKSLKVIWQSLIKELDETAYYPTYKIKAERGVIDGDGFQGKAGFFQPALWGSGYIRTETFSPLWLEPDLLELKPNQKMNFNVGLLNVDKSLLKLAPNEPYELLLYFQNLFDQYFTGNELREGIPIKKSDQKELKKFIRSFFEIQNIAKTKASLNVNQKKESYPARIIGNDYFQFVVINDPFNPLVVSFKIFPDKSPRLFKKVFDDLKKHFEFYVTQVSY